MKAFRLEGSSMKPLFKEGGVAVVRPLVPSFSLSAGDCAVYKYEGRTLLHRVIGTEEKGAWLADDAGRLEPHFVPAKNIEGTVCSRNPLKGGFIGLCYCRLRRFAFRHVHRNNRQAYLPDA